MDEREQASRARVLQGGSGPRGPYVVYALVDPRDERVHYVGRTNEGSHRPWVHWGYRNWLTARCNGQGRSTFEWVAGLKASGAGCYSVEILQTVATFEEVEAAEVAWIARGLAAGWPLTNKRRVASGGIPREVRRRRDAEWLARQRRLSPSHRQEVGR